MLSQKHARSLKVQIEEEEGLYMYHCVAKSKMLISCAVTAPLFLHIYPYGIAAYAGMQRMLISYCIHTVFMLLNCPISAAQLQYIYGSMLVFMLLICCCHTSLQHMLESYCLMYDSFILHCLRIFYLARSMLLSCCYNLAYYY